MNNKSNPSSPCPLLEQPHIPQASFPQQFSCIQQFCSHYNLLIDKKTDWRLTPRVVGSIQGLPTSFGVLQATNGILCYIIQPDDKSCFIGHIQWFVPADQGIDLERTLGLKIERLNKEAREKRKVLLKEYD